MEHRLPGYDSLVTSGQATNKCRCIINNSVLIYFRSFQQGEGVFSDFVFREIWCPPLVKTEVQQGRAWQGYRGLESGYHNTPASLRRGSWTS